MFGQQSVLGPSKAFVANGLLSTATAQGRGNAIKSGAARGVSKTWTGPTDRTRTNRVN